MRGEDFCPLCGKTSGQFIKGLCRECFLKKHNPVEIPKSIEFEQCKACGKIKLFGKMIPFDREKLASVLEKKVHAKGLEKPTIHVSVSQTEQGLHAKALAKGIIDSVPLAFEKTIDLELLPFLCDACMKLSSQYHEAIIQLRPKAMAKAKLKALVPELIGFVESQRPGNSLAVVTEVGETGTGFDLKVGSKKAAQNAVRKMQAAFNAETKASSKLMGVDKKGREKKRFTFLVRV